MLMGDIRGAHLVQRYLLGYRGPTDLSSLHQLAYWCENLAKRGHELGLDCAARLLEIYLANQRDGWFRFTIDTFSKFTEFSSKSTSADEENIRIARRAIDWWSKNKDLVFFDSKAGRFRHRPTSP